MCREWSKGRWCTNEALHANWCLQVVEYNSSSSLYEQLLQMSKTGVYVSVHTSNLANAPFLQPGSAVFELIHVSGTGDAMTLGLAHFISLVGC